MAKKPDDIRGRIEALADFPIEAAAKREALGELNFAQIVPNVAAIQRLISMLRDFDFELIPHRKTQELSSKFSELLSALKRTESFSITVANAGQQRNEIINQIITKSEEVFEALSSTLAVYAAISDPSAERERERDEQSRVALAQIQEAAAKAESSLKAIEKAAGEAGVSKEAKHFVEQANEHKRAAKLWLFATVVFVIATAAWGAFALWYLVLPAAATTAQVVQNTAGKLIILTGLYYGMIWCARNYRASRHNYVVNQHRKNALSTFETFVEAAGKDEITKNAVLLQATTSIFSAQASGYIQIEPDAEQPSKIIEITRSLSGKT